MLQEHLPCHEPSIHRPYTPATGGGEVFFAIPRFSEESPPIVITFAHDQVMEDAPTKLKVSVNVSDADWQKMHEYHVQWMAQEKQMLADHDKQQIGRSIANDSQIL